MSLNVSIEQANLESQASTSSNPPVSPPLESNVAKKVEGSYYWDANRTGTMSPLPTEGASALASAECNPCATPLSPSKTYNVKLVAGNANVELAETVATLLGMRLVRAAVKEAACGEVTIKLQEQVMGDDVFIIQPTSGSKEGNIDLNTALMELLLLIRRLKLAGARRITAIVPFFAYARQDRKTDLRAPISASAVSAMIAQMGVNRVVTVDLHSGQIQGCFNTLPLDNMMMSYEFASYITRQDWFVPEKSVIVSPDAGGVERARKLADILNVGRIVTIVKRRVTAGQVDSMQTVGEVDGLACIVIDDMIDTGGTLVKACELLKKMGATRVIACCTHGIMTDPCSDRLNKSDAIEELVVSDSIPQAHHKQTCKKLTVLSIAPLLATAIVKYHNEESISDLFKETLVTKN